MDTNQPTSGSPDGQPKADIQPRAQPKMELKIPQIPKISLPKVANTTDTKNQPAKSSYAKYTRWKSGNLHNK